MKRIKILLEVIRKKTMMMYFRMIKIQSRKVVFRSYHGTKYNDNPRAISEKLAEIASEQNLTVDIVWITDGAVDIPDYARSVLQGSKKALFELATAKVWVDNVRKDLWDTKRKKQFYIQTWHGGTALKKVEGDASSKLSKTYVKRAHRDSKMANAFISCSLWNTEMYKRAFWYDGDILEYGSPRSDIFYGDNNLARTKIVDCFALNADTKIVLYAPTFRNSENLDAYDIDYERLLKCLHQCWGGDWRVVVRLHPNLANKQNEIAYSANVLNGSSYPDINEMIMACDLLISDYSSCIFDAMEAGKRVIIYASDVDDYLDERGLYFSLDELPFPIVTNNQELTECIDTYSADKYKHDVASFMHKLGYVNDGKASERCANLIISRMGISQNKKEIR